MTEKEEIVRILLENQKNYVKEPNPADEIEPFSWMDNDVKTALSKKLPPEEMEAMDKAARSMLGGQKIMMRSISRAFANALKGKNEQGPNHV